MPNDIFNHDIPAPALGPAPALATPALVPAPAPAPTTAGRDELYIIPWEADPGTEPGTTRARPTSSTSGWGTLGPSTTWFLRYCAGELERADGAAVELSEVAATLGIGHRGGANSPMSRAVTRACRFRAARPAGPGTLEVRRRLPTLNRRQLQRLPAAAQRRHEIFLMAANAAGGVDEQRRKARRLALGLIECGDGYDDAELQTRPVAVPPGHGPPRRCGGRGSATTARPAAQPGAGAGAGLAKPEASSTRVRTPNPVPPLGISP